MNVIFQTIDTQEFDASLDFITQARNIQCILGYPNTFITSNIPSISLVHIGYWKCTHIHILKHRGRADFPIKRRGRLIDPITLAQAFTVI